jgi:hypothetical protein
LQIDNEPFCPTATVWPRILGAAAMGRGTVTLEQRFRYKFCVIEVYPESPRHKVLTP